MIIDFHTHIFSKTLQENRARYFSSEPAFKLLYGHPDARMAGAEELLNQMDESSVDKSVIFGFPWQNSDIFERENDIILDAVQKYPDRFIGFACFDPMHTNAAQEAERCLKAGLSGVGELAFYGSDINISCQEALRPIMNICRKHDCPMLIHVNEPLGHIYPGKSPNTLAKIYEFIKKFEQNKIVLAHWGGGIFFYKLLKRETKKVLKNVWYDTAASPFLYDKNIYETALKLAGSDKILLGTDYPLIKPERYLKDIQKSNISEFDKAKICGENASNLLNLSKI